jgi:hypothetical protein
MEGSGELSRSLTGSQDNSCNPKQNVTGSNPVTRSSSPS